MVDRRDIKWVRYKDMGGPRFVGNKLNGEYAHRFLPEPPWDEWTKILGCVARCEGNHDTVVMYDGTGVTFGAFQWTFKSGRLQKLLESFKDVPVINFETDKETNLFDQHLVRGGTQVFERFGFRIAKGRFYDIKRRRKLNPVKQEDRDRIVDICMGADRPVSERKQFAMDLCLLFAELGQHIGVHAACVDFAIEEFEGGLDVNRKVLKEACTIRGMLPEEVWGSPIPAIFYNLYQNLPGSSFKLFRGALKKAVRKEIVELGENGYTNVSDVDGLLDIIWRDLNNTAYAHWGFKSRRYLSSRGKQLPRITRLQPALKEFYDVELELKK